MRVLIFGLIIFLSSMAVATPTLPVHLFVVKKSLVFQSFSTLGRAWFEKMKTQNYKEVLPGQFATVQEIFVPVIEGDEQFKDFQNEFPETATNLRAMPLKNSGSFLVYDPKDSSIGALRIDIADKKAAASLYAKDEIEASVVNSKILYDAVDKSSKVEILPIIFGQVLNDGPLNYSYIVRPFKPKNTVVDEIKSTQDVDQNEFLEFFARSVATLNFKFGIYTQLNSKNIELIVDRNNKVKSLVIQGTKNVTVDNFLRITQSQEPIKVGRRTPQINRFHFYYPGLSQPGENVAVFATDTILKSGVAPTLALRIFLRSYILAVSEITGVSVAVNKDQPLSDSQLKPQSLQNFLGNAIQTIYQQVIEAKRPSVKDLPLVNTAEMQTEFLKKYDASQVSFLDYHSPYWGLKNFDLAWRQLKNQIGYTFDPATKTILAYETDGGHVLAVAYDIKKDEMFAKSPSESFSLKDYLARYKLGLALTFK